jgi:hypothetical protein
MLYNFVLAIIFVRISICPLTKFLPMNFFEENESVVFVKAFCLHYASCYDYFELDRALKPGFYPVPEIAEK